MKRLPCILFLLCFGFSLSGQQTVRKIDASRLVEIVYPPLTEREGKDLQLPVPPDEHPRLFFRKADVPRIRAKSDHPLMKNCWETLRQQAKYQTDGTLVRENSIHNVDMQVIQAIEARAFLYAFEGDRTCGNEAIDFLFNLHNSLIINPEKPDVCRDIGRVILTTALVYDWCHDLIKEDEKASLIAVMESLATEMEVKWPRLVQGSVCGHGVEAQLARDLLSCGIAVYDEKPDIYTRAAGRIMAEFIPALNFWYPGGHHHQGSAYGPIRYQWEIYITLLFDRMGYPQIVDPLQGKVPYYWLYTRRSDGQLLRDGDDFNEQYMPFGEYWDFPVIAYVASYYKDNVLMGEAMKQDAIGKNCLFDILLVDPALLTVDPALLPGKDKSALPLTRYFPSPYGGMVARTGWEDGMEASSVVAEMKVAEYYFANHQHLDAGCFQLYYKGPLAVQSGIYQGTEGGYGGSHFTHYYQRSIAHNCLLVYDPDEKFIWHNREVSNDGGQRFPANASEPATITKVLTGDYRRAEVLAHDFGPDIQKPEYSYLKGDLANTYTGKVTHHNRSFVFLNLDNAEIPAALIVYDYITSAQKDFKKTWLMHCVQEPVFDGNSFEIRCDKKGYNGRLVNMTLLPLAENLQMVKVGGLESQFVVGGINYPQQLIAEKNSGDGAAWRMELSPRQAAETDCFLNVMQVMDAKGAVVPLKVEKIETDHHTGMKMGDRIVLFSKKGTVENQSVRLKIEGKGNYKVLITDLEKGEWEVVSPSGFIHTITNEESLVYFPATAGEFIIRKKSY